jgi:hypothetical protein
MSIKRDLLLCRENELLCQHNESLCRENEWLCQENESLCRNNQSNNKLIIISVALLLRSVLPRSIVALLLSRATNNVVIHRENL